MTTTQPMGQAGQTPPKAATTPVQTPAQPAPASAATRGYAPAHYLRRTARFVILRAAVRGRLGWPAALAMLARIDGTARPVQAPALARKEGGAA